MPATWGINGFPNRRVPSEAAATAIMSRGQPPGDLTGFIIWRV